jgi:hypothetical protein
MSIKQRLQIIEELYRKESSLDASDVERILSELPPDYAAKVVEALIKIRKRYNETGEYPKLDKTKIAEFKRLKLK